jgi:hypothetical protein
MKPIVPPIERDDDLGMRPPRCIAEDLVGGEGFAVDASMIRLMATGSAACWAASGRLPRRQTVPCGNILRCSMMPRSVPQPRFSFLARAAVDAPYQGLG